MENLDSFKNAQKHFNIWAPERQKVLKELATIRDEIQRQIRIYSIGSITYSSVNLVSGGLVIAGIATAPSTLGLSLALTVAGIATGFISRVAGSTHGIVKFGIVWKQCNDAKASLEKHTSTCADMCRLAVLFKNDIALISRSFDPSFKGEIFKTVISAAGVGKGIHNLVHNSRAVHVYRLTGSEYDVAHVNRINKVLDKILPPGFKDTSKGATTFSTASLSIMAAAGILIDLGFLFKGAVELFKIEKGKLYGEAEKLDKVIKELQNEYDCLKSIFT